VRGLAPVNAGGRNVVYLVAGPPFVVDDLSGDSLTCDGAVSATIRLESRGR
jgi:hypothetical protein